MAEPARSVVPALELRVLAAANSLSYELRLREPGPGEARFQTYRQETPRRGESPFTLAEYLTDLWRDLEQEYGDSPAEKAQSDRRQSALGARMAEYLMPPALRRQLAADSAEPKSLVIISDEPRIPWEIAWLEGGGPEPGAGCFLAEAFALARGIVDRPEILDYPFQNIALLVASGSQLPDADSERNVVLGLANPSRVVREIRPEYLEVLDEIASGRHDAWHFIGHSSARAKDADRWPLELGGGSEVRPGDVRSLDARRGAPFVFLNSCASGRGGFTLTGFGGWAERFIGLGAGAFLGPQWSVRDHSSSRFAELFYERFRRGIPIAEAVRQARVALAPIDRGTRLSYALYAHPEAVCTHPDRHREGSNSRDVSVLEFMPSREVHTWRRPFNEGMCLMYGLQGKVDFPTAQRSFLAAADTGNPIARAWLARLKAAGGCNFPRDMSAARSFSQEEICQVEKSANQGDSTAELVLGFALLDGIGLEADPDRAVEFLKQAAEKGDLVAMNCLGTLAGNGMSQAEALSWCIRAVEGGNSLAMTNLAARYLEGQGVEANSSLAIRWYQAAADRGYPPAMNSLGDIYRQGKVVKNDSETATKWYQLGADREDSSAITRLGWAYLKGDGIELDNGKAIECFRRAIELQNTFAMRSLGAIYADGNPLPRDYGMTLRLWSQAAELGDVDAMACIGKLYETGEGVALDPAKATEWYRRAAEGGDAEAACKMGTFFLEGTGVERNPVEAVRWFHRSADQGYAAAMCSLADAYDSASGLPQDKAAALSWYQKAAELESLTAMNAIGFKYQTGDGVASDLQQALNWYHRAAENGSPDGMNNVGVILERAEKPAESVIWYRKSAEAGHAYGMYNLGRFYKFGIGVEKDPEKAREWLVKANKAGHPSALSLIDETTLQSAIKSGLSQLWENLTK